MATDSPFRIAWERVEGMSRQAIALLPNLVIASLVFLLFLGVAYVLRRTVQRVSARHERGRSVALVLGRLAQGVVILVGLFVALSILIPTFNAGSLVQLLGISGVAIGFAFRDILQNFLAGILILLTQPFRLNDQIVFKDFEGTVEEIQTRATLLKTYDGRRIVIPNAELFTNSVTVNTAFDSRRLQYDVGIGYGDDVALAKKVMLEAVAGIEGVLRQPAPDVLLLDLAESTVNLRLRFWVSPPRRSDCLNFMDSALSEVKKRLVENGIDLPFPTRQILFHDQTESSDGDRSKQREGWPSRKDGNPEAARLDLAFSALFSGQRDEAAGKQILAQSATPPAGERDGARH